MSLSFDCSKEERSMKERETLLFKTYTINMLFNTLPSFKVTDASRTKT